MSLLNGCAQRSVSEGWGLMFPLLELFFQFSHISPVLKDWCPSSTEDTARRTHGPFTVCAEVCMELYPSHSPSWHLLEMLMDCPGQAPATARAAEGVPAGTQSPCGGARAGMAGLWAQRHSRSSQDKGVVRALLAQGCSFALGLRSFSYR